MKKVFILTAGFGEGHNTAARNILAALKHLAPGEVDARLVDIYAEANPAANARLRKLYLMAINDFPLAWSIFYRVTDYWKIPQRLMFLFDEFTRALEALVERERPDILVSTYPFYGHLIARFRPSVGALPLRNVVIVTDSISINSIWHTDEADLYVVPNQETSRVMEKAGVPNHMLKPLGFPVNLDFALSRPAEELQPPSAKNPPRILYMLNSGHQHAETVLEGLLSHPDWQVTVAVGKDEKIMARMKAFTATHSHRVALLGWISNMPELLMTHHILIGKAGGATVQESIAAHCPMIISKVVPGQEEGNYFLLKTHNAGTLASSPEDIPVRVAKAFENDAAQWKEWRKNLQSLAQPDAALKIANEIIFSTSLTA